MKPVLIILVINKPLKVWRLTWEAYLNFQIPKQQKKASFPSEVGRFGRLIRVGEGDAGW